MSPFIYAMQIPAHSCFCSHLGYFVGSCPARGTPSLILPASLLCSSDSPPHLSASSLLAPPCNLCRLGWTVQPSVESSVLMHLVAPVMSAWLAIASCILYTPLTLHPEWLAQIFALSKSWRVWHRPGTPDSVQMGALKSWDRLDSKIYHDPSRGSLGIFVVVVVVWLLSHVQLFFDPLDCTPPGSSVHEIFQARILEWVAVPSSRGSSSSRFYVVLNHLFFSTFFFAFYKSLHVYSHDFLPHISSDAS